jgi:hypothetical protein
MKRKFKEGLEKIIEVSKDACKNIKKNGEKTLIAFSLPFLINSSVSGGYLGTRCNSSFTKPIMGISHKTGAREPEEGYDVNGKDIFFFEYPCDLTPFIVPLHIRVSSVN